ncbi:hypothetical protein ACI8AV_17865 [Geodermatophilus sp. SYSU D00804]
MQLYVDLSVDWRRDEPVTLAVGPVLSLEDAVGNKVAALFSQAEAWDFLDVDTIRAAGRFTDEELLAAAAERDPSFDVHLFGRQLEAVRRVQPVQVARYRVDATQCRRSRSGSRSGRRGAWRAQRAAGGGIPGGDRAVACGISPAGDRSDPAIARCA